MIRKTSPVTKRLLLEVAQQEIDCKKESRLVHEIISLGKEAHLQYILMECLDAASPVYFPSSVYSLN